MANSELLSRVRRLLRLQAAADAGFVLSGGLASLLSVLLAVVFFFLPGWLALFGLIPFGLLIVAVTGSRTLVAAARRIEQGFPTLGRRLLPAVQLVERPGAGRLGYSRELAAAAIADAWQTLQPLPVERLVRWRRALLAVAGLALVLGFWAMVQHRAGDRLGQGWYRSFAPSALPLELEVEPGHARLAKGETLTIKVSVNSPFDIRGVTLERRSSGQSGSRTPVPLKQGKASLAEEVTDEFDYRVTCLGRATPFYHVGLKQPLAVTSLSFSYRYPSYARLADNTSQGREIAALVGTQVEVRGECDHELATGELVFSDSQRTELRVSGRTFQGRFGVRRAGEFELVLRDVTGAQNSPERFRVAPIQDEYPLVRLFAPGASMNLPSEMKVMLGVNSVDDYGLTALTLCYAKDSLARMVPLRNVGGKLEDTTYYLWDLSRMDLLPGATVQYYVMVADNDAVSGPKTSRSETFTLRFPTMTDLFNEATRKTAEVESLMQPLTEQQRQLQQQTGKIDDALKRNRQLSWEDQQSLQSVLSNQDSLLAAIRNLRQDVRQAMQNMLQSIALDSEAFQGLRALDTLLSQILPKQMLQALDSLRQAMGKGPQPMRSAMQKLQYSQADMQKAIERAIDLLKRLRQEQQMDALVRKTEELLKEQEKILKNPKSENNAQLAERQAAVKDGLDSLAQQLAGLAQELKDQEPGKDLKDAAEQMASDSMSPQAGAASREYQQGKSGSARQKGGKLKQQLSSLRDQLQKAREKMNKKRSQDVAEKLLRAANDLLTLSDAQEDLEARMKTGKDLADLVGEEQRLGDAARVVAETLVALSARNMKVPPQLGEPIVRALKDAEDAAAALQDNNGGQAQTKGRNARSGLDQAIERILKTLKSAQQGGGFGGGMESLLEQLSRAISEQMGLGQEMGGMMPIPMPGGMSGEMMQMWQQLMARQQALREALEQMMKSKGGTPGMSGNVDAAIEEMKQLERDMSSMNPQRPMVERSERIVNKLLDAQRSIRQREQTEQRESESGRQFQVPPTPRLPADLGERKRFLREELMRALKEDFPREYEPAVRAYFEALLK
jgi:hypothetical protein